MTAQLRDCLRLPWRGVRLIRFGFFNDELRPAYHAGNPQVDGHDGGLRRNGDAVRGISRIGNDEMDGFPVRNAQGNSAGGVRFPGDGVRRNYGALKGEVQVRIANSDGQIFSPKTDGTAQKEQEHAARSPRAIETGASAGGHRRNVCSQLSGEANECFQSVERPE